MRLQNNVYLIGLMGVGKTTTGRTLAALLQAPFVDTDQALEQRTGVSVQHIFEVEGEAGFRKREAKLLTELCAGNPPQNGDGDDGDDDDDRGGAVIATGGGIILCQRNRQLMRDRGTVIYLRASLELLWTRLQSCRQRPLLKVPHPQRTLTRLFAERDPLYAAAAELTVEVHAESSAQTASKIHALLQP